MEKTEGKLRKIIKLRNNDFFFEFLLRKIVRT